MTSTILSVILAINSFVVQFTQQKQSLLFDSIQKSSGKLTFLQPDYIKWEYFSPDSLVWELDSNKGNMPRQIKDMLMLIREGINGDFEQAKVLFELSIDGNSITLVPKKRELKNIFNNIRISLNPMTQIADYVEMTEANGDKTIIYFTDVQFLER